jgi:hypothetical protein
MHHFPTNPPSRKARRLFFPAVQNMRAQKIFDMFSCLGQRKTPVMGITKTPKPTA